VAIGANVRAGLVTKAGGADVTYPGSAYGSWVQIHDDLTAAADAAAVLIRPWSIANANMHPLVIGPGVSRIFLVGRYPVASSVTTLPVLRFWGSHNAAIVDDGSGGPGGTRLDNVDANAAGITLPFNLTNTNDWRDTTYRYSDMVTISGTDLLGCQVLTTYVETACVVSAGVATLWALVLN